MQRFLILFITVSLILTQSTLPLKAQTEDRCTEELLRTVGATIINCDGSAATSCELNSTTASPQNLDYKGGEIFNDTQLEQIERNKATYVAAATEQDVPWQAIAAIHMRETRLKRLNPSNGQGIYQFYSGAGGPYPTGEVSEAEFLRQTKFMAKQLKDDYFQRTPIVENREVTALFARPEAVKDMFFSYNGRRAGYAEQGAQLGFDKETQPYEGSPYVMNIADQSRDPAFNTTTWGQVKVDGGPIEYPANGDHGAFLQYTALGGAGQNCDSTSNQTVVEIATRELSLGAKQADGSYLKYTGGVEAEWCAYFVSWVFNEAGKPFQTSTGVIPSVFDMRAYAIDKGYYTEVSDESYTPAPGDIVVYKEGLDPYPSHVNIVTFYDAANRVMTTIGGNESDTIKQAEIRRDLPAVSGFIRIP